MNKEKEWKVLIKKLAGELKRFVPGAEIILFGSRARGDYNKESDVDLLILLERKTKEIEDRILEICYQFELKHEIIIVPLIHSKKEWESFPYNVSEIRYIIEKEGIKI